MAQLDEIDKKLSILVIKLYGENGFEGDISEIKKSIANFAGGIEDNRRRSVLNRYLIATLFLSLLGGGGLGITKLIEILSKVS